MLNVVCHSDCKSFGETGVEDLIVLKYALSKLCSSLDVSQDDTGGWKLLQKCLYKADIYTSAGSTFNVPLS